MKTRLLILFFAALTCSMAVRAAVFVKDESGGGTYSYTKEEIQEKVENYQKVLNNLMQEIENLKNQITAKQEEADRVQAEIEALKPAPE